MKGRIFRDPHGAVKIHGASVGNWYYTRFDTLPSGSKCSLGLSDVVGHLQVFRRMRLCVSLKNWPGLRFWTKAGFRTIVEVAGESSFGHDLWSPDP